MKSFFTVFILTALIMTVLPGCHGDCSCSSDGGADVGFVVCSFGGDAGVQKVTQVDSTEGCLKYMLSSESDVVVIGSKDVSFVMTVTNVCADPYTIHKGETPPGGFCITTHGTSCTMGSLRGVSGNQYVAILPRDGWSMVVFDLTLQKDESYTVILPWNGAADGMVNYTPAPPCLYDVFGFLGANTDAFGKSLTIEVSY